MTVVATLGQGLSGVRPETPSSLVLDSGILYANIDVAALRASGSNQVANAVAAAVKMGATRGGVSLETGREVRMIDVDGKRFPIKGLNRVSAYEPAMTLSLLEFTRANLQRSVSPLTQLEHAAFYEYRLSLEISDSAYFANIALFTTISGFGDPLVLVLENAMAVESQEFALEDNNEMVMETRFVGFADPATPYTSPLMFFYPKTLPIS